MLTMNLVRTKKNTMNEVRVYEVVLEGTGTIYTVYNAVATVENFKEINDIDICSDVKLSNELYLPDIYVRTADVDCKKTIFKITTTSYGTLESEKIEKMLNGYNLALETIKLVKETLEN